MEMKIEPKEFWEGLKWGEENYSELMRKYPERWVAIVDKKVVGVGRSMSEAEKEAYKETGVEIKRIPVIFVEREPIQKLVIEGKKLSIYCFSG